MHLSHSVFALAVSQALTREAKLREACMQGSTKQVKLMIKRGADVRAADEEGFTPMHSAAVSGSAKLVKLLAEAGAMPDTPDTVRTLGVGVDGGSMQLTLLVVICCVGCIGVATVW